MPRTIAIGDIHGGLRALQQLLDRIAITPKDHLIFLGDYVDGWSESKEVVDHLFQLREYCTCTFIKGNHDAWAQEWLNTGYIEPFWKECGGWSTLESYRGMSKEVKQQHQAFFNALKPYYIDTQNRLFIHAGYSSDAGPAAETYNSHSFWDRSLWRMSFTAHYTRLVYPDRLPKRLALFSEIYLGHTPTTHWGYYEPMHRANVWNIDTGAAYTGALSAIDVDSHKIWQSDPVQRLYPDEFGRN